MAPNPVQTRANRPAHWRQRCVAVLLAWLCAAQAYGQTDLAERLPPELRDRFLPTAKPLEHENRVLRSALIEQIPTRWQARRRAERLWRAAGGVVLAADQPGLVLHFYAEGIKSMTLADRVWEGLPTQAESMQQLIDSAIIRARKADRPIARLIIAGHAGLPGCAAWGGTLDDCTFDGKLTAYQRQQLARLRPYLAHDAEIELRQCGTGSGEAGQRLLESIHEITRAAASSYLADFHFGDAAAHPRVRVAGNGLEIVKVKK